MEIERSIYRVHERILESKVYQVIVKVTLKLATVFTIFLISTLLLSIKTVYSDKTLQQIITKYQNQTDDIPSNIYDSYFNIIFGPFKQPFQNQHHIFKNQTNHQDVLFANNSVENNVNQIMESVYHQFTITGKNQMLSLNPKLRKRHNFTQNNIFINSNLYLDSSILDLLVQKFVGYDDYLIYQLALMIKQDGFFEQLCIQDQQQNLYYLQKPQQRSTLESIYNLVHKVGKILIGLFIAFNITAIYSRVTLIIAPLIILTVHSCSFNRNMSQQFLTINISRAFPWIGAYIIRQFSSPQNARFSMFFRIAMFMVLVLFYCLYIAVTMILSKILFDYHYMKDISDNFFGFIAINEFLSLLFARTYTSLKYFPIFIVYSSFIFVLHYQSSIFGFYQLELTILLFFGIIVFTLLMYLIEIPALGWPSHQHYKPDQDKPRVMYFPYFSTNMISDLPQLWSFFYPLHSARYFTDYQMSWMNQNFISLNIYANMLTSPHYSNQEMQQFDIQEQNQL